MAEQSPTTIAPPPQRRTFLSALLAASALGAAPAIAAKAAAPTESPELLELGERLSSLGRALAVSVARWDEAKALFERTRPALPEDLRAKPCDRMFDMIAGDMDVAGGETASIYVDRRVRAHIVLHDISRHTRQGKRLRRIARIARQYEAAERAADDASGRDACQIEAQSAAMAYTNAVCELRDHEASTMSGVLILARAAVLASVAGTTLGYPADFKLAREICRRVADSVLRVAGEVNHG